MVKDRGLTRRGFLQGSAVGAGAAVLAGFGASVAGAAAVPKRWNKEVDVVIVGFGGAGAAAAVAAKEAGGKALILEKMPHGGGNSAVSSGAMAIPNDVAKGITYMKAQTFGTVDDDELIKTFVEESDRTARLVSRVGCRHQIESSSPRTSVFLFSEAPRERLHSGGAG